MKKNIVWIAQLIPALFMLQTIIWYKFPGHKDSIYIFTQIGMEPYGRIGSGVVELIASVLLFTSRYSWIGALLGLGTMTGALFFHLTTLGIVVKNDNGFLFTMAAVLWICCLTVLILRKKQIPIKL